MTNEVGWHWLWGVGLAFLSSCAPSPVMSVQKRSDKPKDPYQIPFVPKLRVIPEVDEAQGLVKREIGFERRIIGRMRVLTRSDGTIERASDLLPVGKVTSVDLPARLGGGLVFALSGGRGTQLWRAESWLAPLKPLVTLAQVADADAPLVVGFDRIYVRLRSQNDLIAIDVDKGKLLRNGPLPPAPSLGDMVFLDGWRAVAEVDLQGVLATFDAGATWKRLPIEARLRSIVADGQDPIVAVEGGEYRLSSRGDLTFTPSAAVANQVESLPAATGRLPNLPARQPDAASVLGKRPLRTALEYGYPDSATSVVIARSGAISRVSLVDGRVLAIQREVIAPTMDCQGIRLGESFGFVCGETSGKTSILEYVAPLGVRQVLSFDEPRMVTESGQGAIVVHGSCGAARAEAAAVRVFCVRDRAGSVREIRVRGSLDGERVVALLDGRVAILVPPRAGSQGQLSLIEGATAKHLPLKLPAKGPLAELERGLWLDGLQQTSDQEISGWVDAGGSMVGIRVTLDGNVTAFELVTEELGVLVSGRFGLALGDRGRGLETVDFGKTWKDIDLVPMKGKSLVRKCGPAGCALPGILRIGWGEPAVEHDLGEVRDPDPVQLSTSGLATTQRLVARCSLAQGTAPKVKPSRKEGEVDSDWPALENVEAPKLLKGETGVHLGVGQNLSSAVGLYVWGNAGADWSRRGKFVGRFVDRFGSRAVQSTAVTAAPFADEAAANEALGRTTGFGVSAHWTTLSDPGGRGVLVAGCRGRACMIFLMEEGRPIVTVRSSGSDRELPKPIGLAVAHVAERWYYLAEGPHPDRVALQVIDGDVVSTVAEIPRLHAFRAGLQVPKLVKRSDDSGIGLLFATRAGPLDKRPQRYVVPFTGANYLPGRVQAVGHNLHLADRCQGRHGWVSILSESDLPSDIAVAGRSVEGVSFRARLAENFSCIEAAAGTLDAPTEGPDPPKGGFPLYLRNQPVELRCSTTLSFPK